MTHFYVLYDEGCTLCRRARSWLEGQAQIVPLYFVAAGSQEARRRFPQLDSATTLKRLNVVSDRGEVYRGAKAWVVCLWALRDHRERAMLMASPEMMPLARRFVAWVSDHRYDISRAVS